MTGVIDLQNLQKSEELVYTTSSLWYPRDRTPNDVPEAG
jgi:hypothetical protein